MKSISTAHYWLRQHAEGEFKMYKRSQKEIAGTLLSLHKGGAGNLGKSPTNACSPNAMGPIFWRRAGCRDSLQARLGCRLVTPTSQSAIPDPLGIPRQLFRISGRRIGPGYLRASEAQSPRPQGSVASCGADRDRAHW